MARQGSRRRIAPSVYQDGSGFAAIVYGNGHRRELRFPPNTPMRKIKAALEEARTQLRKLPRGERHTLAYDARRYLERVKPILASYIDRERHLNAWLSRFGHLHTLSLGQHTTALNDQLREWRKDYSASSCNQRRDALSNCVKVLHGKRAALELVDVIRFRMPPPVARWISRERIEAVLAQLQPGSKTEARLRLMHWTGMRPSQMGRLARENFHLDEPIPFIIVPQGKRGYSAMVPLVPEGRTAAEAFLDADAFRPWSCSSANKALARAAEKARVERFSVYAIRHSFAAGLRHTGADVADIQDLYGHMDPKTTRIYARESLTKHLQAIARLRKPDEAGETTARDLGTKTVTGVSH